MGFFALISAAFLVYSEATTANYRELRNNEASGIVAFESERVGKLIAEMERNAVDLALAGLFYYKSDERSEQLGASIPVRNFESFREAVGGGIWFEPYALDDDTFRKCFYAFYDAKQGDVRYDPEFMSEAYDYHNQRWYVKISNDLKEGLGVAWTEPYYETIGTNSLMTTVGAGIYNDAGRLVGMSTVDWQIQSMVDELSSIKPTENSFVLLASPKDDYIISNTHTYETVTEYVGVSLSELPWYSALKFSEDGSVGISQFTEEHGSYVSFSRLFDNGWLFSVQIPANEIYSMVEARNRRFTATIAISSALLLAGTFYLLSRLINRPLERLIAGVSELGEGNLNGQIEITVMDEFGMLAEAFNRMTVDLKESIEQSTRERAEKERIGAELNIAAKIQASMLPCTFPPFPNRTDFDIYAYMTPAKEVGGDFYDFFLIDNDTLAVVIADVSGKGVPAALFMVIARTLIKNNALSGKSPREVFETVNNMLCENNEAFMFVTAFMGYIDIPSGRFTYVNAGHTPPLLYSGGLPVVLETHNGFVLAVMGELQFKQSEVILNKGDKLFLYTDGVTEAMNEKEELFGEERLLEAASEAKNLSITKLIEHIKKEIDEYAEGVEQADDITMLALCFGGFED